MSTGGSIDYPHEPDLGSQVQGEEIPEKPQLGNTITAEQLKQIRHLLKFFVKFFTAQLGRTTLLHYTIQTEPRMVVLETMWPLPR